MDIVGLYVYGQFYGKVLVYGNLAHAHAVDTRPSLGIIEGLGTRLVKIGIFFFFVILCIGINPISIVMLFL